MRIINVDMTQRRARIEGTGNFSTYYKLSKHRGLKLMDRENGECFESPWHLQRSEIWKDTKREIKLLSVASKTGIGPKPYGIAVVKKRNDRSWNNELGKHVYFAGIVMEHIHGDLLESFCFHDFAEDTLLDKLQEVGINHSDLHGENIMVQKTKQGVLLRAIDYSPHFCHYKKPRRKKGKKRRIR